MDKLPLIPNESTDNLQNNAEASQLDQSKNDLASLPKVAPSEASSNPSSPTHSNPMTPERHHSLEFDHFTLNAIDFHGRTPEAQVAQEEFPNPYDKPLIPPFSGHARVSSAPDLTKLHESTHSVQRLPSVLRPAHPKTFDSVGSRRATQAFSSGSEFGASPLAFGDWRSSIHSLPNHNTEDIAAYALSQGPYAPRSQSAISWLPQPSPSIIEHEASDASPMTHQDVENNRVPSAQSGHVDAADAVGSRAKDENPKESVKDDHITRQPTDLWPAKAVAMGSVKPKPKWKFWSKGKW